MTDLAQRRCEPCTGKTPALTPDEVARLISQVPGYEVDAGGTAIARTYQFKNYYRTIAFVNAVAFIAHREDHHPDLEVGYDKVRVRYATHAVGGLTLNDFVCAAKVNQLVE